METCRNCGADIKRVELREGWTWAHTQQDWRYQRDGSTGWIHKAEPAGAPDLRDPAKVEEWLSS